MSTVAEQLRLAREAKNLSITQVADITKIRTDHLRALEEGNFNVFSAPVYIKGFVRTYAMLLKMDVAGVMQALDGELGKTDRFSEPPPLSTQKRGVLDFLTLQLSKLNWRTAVIVLSIAAVAGVVFAVILILRHQSTNDPLANIPPAEYHSAPSGETVPLPTNAPHH
jgi:cytoskeletal protein RodZ